MQTPAIYFTLKLAHTHQMSSFRSCVKQVHVRLHGYHEISTKDALRANIGEKRSDALNFLSDILIDTIPPSHKSNIFLFTKLDTLVILT